MAYSSRDSTPTASRRYSWSFLIRRLLKKLIPTKFDCLAYLIQKYFLMLTKNGFIFINRIKMFKIFIIKIFRNISFISTIRILNSFLVNTIYFRMRIMLLKQILILIASDYSRLNAEEFSGVQAVLSSSYSRWVSQRDCWFSYFRGLKLPSNKYFKRHRVIPNKDFVISMFKTLSAQEMVFIAIYTRLILRKKL